MCVAVVTKACVSLNPLTRVHRDFVSGCSEDEHHLIAQYCQNLNGQVSSHQVSSLNVKSIFLVCFTQTVQYTEQFTFMLLIIHTAFEFHLHY